MEFPSLNKANSNLKPAVIAINVGGTEDDLKKYIKDNDLNMDVVLDVDNKLSGAFAVSAYPTNVIIDKKGKVLGIIPGMLDDDSIKSIVKDIEAGAIK